jgi:hypothetical protein
LPLQTAKLGLTHGAHDAEGILNVYEDFNCPHKPDVQQHFLPTQVALVTNPFVKLPCSAGAAAFGKSKSYAARRWQVSVLLLTLGLAIQKCPSALLVADASRLIMPEDTRSKADAASLREVV